MKSFAIRAFRVAVADDGLTCAHPTRVPGAPDGAPDGVRDGVALARLEIGDLRRAGEPVGGRLESMTVDADEVELRHLTPGLAAIEIRHSFVAGWRTRVVLAELSGSAWTASFRLALRPGPGYQVWRLATGTDSVVALLPRADPASVLAVQSGTGRAPIRAGADPGAVEIGPYRLAPGERLVTSWQWTDARHPRQLTERLESSWPVLPRRFTVPVGEEIWLPTDPDTALIVPPEVAAENLDERLALTCEEPGRHRIELRSARGSSTYELGWAPPVLDFLADAAEAVLAAPVGPTGVVPLPDVAAAIVVQSVARISGFPAAIEAGDALDQFTARLGDPRRSDTDPALSAVYLAGEYDRLGDPDLIDRAQAAIAGATPGPGLGLAVVRTALAAVLAGGRPATPPATGPPSGTAPLSVADLELALATRPPDALAADERVLAALYGIGVDLRAGLPGLLPTDRGPDELTHALAVLRLVPDRLGSWWRHRFGSTVAEFVDHRSLELVDRLRSGRPGSSAGAVSVAHAWLALGS